MISVYYLYEVLKWPRTMVRQIPLIFWASSSNWTHSVSCYLIMFLNNISEQHVQTEVGV